MTFALSALALLAVARPAGASTTQLSMFEIPGFASLPQDPASTLQTLRSLGVNLLRVGVYWSDFAPNPSSRLRPLLFNAADPNAYPLGTWMSLDRLVHEAQSDGIQLEFTITGGAPLWATQTGGPPCQPNGGWCYDNTFEPSASEYGQFVQAVATRYPSVHFWELWNEANWGPSLTPQYLNSSVPISAYVYRGLLDAGWNALHASGHGGDTIIDTSLSQDGSLPVGETGTTAPLVFIRTLYCATSSYGHLTGDAASQVGCPTTTAGYQQFMADHPALFQASGVGVHPYPYGGPPTHVDYPSPDGAEFAEIPQLTTALDRLQKLYTSSVKPMAAYNTEYAYRTRPNDTQSVFATPAKAAAYINQAEYLSWKNPRIATYDQYELEDGGWFPTGLLFAPGTGACPGAVACPKPSFYSYRFPVWLPMTSIPRGRATEVWGNARPAYFARLDTGQPQSVRIQWAPRSSNRFQTVKTVQTSALGYFDTRVKFPGSGQVRLAWEYPPGDAGLNDPLDASAWIYSRVTKIALYKQKASGYLSGRRRLGLKITRSKGAPRIRSLSVRPPDGLKFSCVRAKKACRGLAVGGASARSATVSHGALIINLLKPTRQVSITAGPPLLRAAGSLNKRRLKVTLVVTDASGAPETISIRLAAR